MKVIKSVKSYWKFVEDKYCKAYLEQKEVTGDYQKCIQESARKEKLSLELCIWE